MLDQLFSAQKAVQKCQIVCVGFCLDFHALKTQLSCICLSVVGPWKEKRYHQILTQMRAAYWTCPLFVT